MMMQTDAKFDGSFEFTRQKAYYFSFKGKCSETPCFSNFLNLKFNEYDGSKYDTLYMHKYVDTITHIFTFSNTF